MPDYGLGNKLFPAGLRACGDGGKEEEMNTWPGGHRHAMYQSEHEKWNAHNYPGTRQLCVECDQPTGRCEDDSLFTDNGDGPFCPECWSDKEEEMKQKRWLLMEVPEDSDGGYVQWKKGADDTGWTDINKEDLIPGPVELMQAACRGVGVKYWPPLKGELFLNLSDDELVIEKADWEWTCPMFVILAPAPAELEPKKCQNCQGIISGHLVKSFFDNGVTRCFDCDRPMREWTYAT